MLGACTSEEDTKDEPGSIYGIVTELGTAEPMKAVGVELYKGGSLLMKTVTFDDGHFEFKDLNSGNYQVKVVADEYEQTDEGRVTVEAGRQARIDLQVRATLARICGIVTYAGTDTPVADAEIVLKHDNYKIEDGPQPYVYAKVYSDQNGYFNIDHIEPLIYHERLGLIVSVKYYISARKGDYSFGGYYGELIELKAGETRQVNLQVSKVEQ